MASRMFADGFESYTVGSRLPLTTWNTEDSRIAAMIVSAPTDGLFSPHGGSKMARCRWNGTIPLSDLNNFETLAINPDTYANNEWFIRVYLRLDNNFDIISPTGSGSHLLRSLHTSPTTMEFVEDQSSNSTNTGVRVNSNNFDVSVFAGKLQPGQWYKYERYVHYGSGIIRTWWNGSLRAESTTLNFAGSKFGNLNLASNWGDPSPDATNDLYFDDFELFSDLNTGSAVTGLMSNATIQVSGGGADTTPPTAPSSLSATAMSASRIDLSWTASTDAVGVTNYLVERALGAGSFAQIGTSATTTYSDTGLAESTTYRYQVRATDAAGNLSAYSSIVTQTTLPLPPAPPTNLRFA